MRRVPLIGVAHGSRDDRAGRHISALMREVAARRPGLTAKAAFVELTEPGLPEVLHALDGPVVIVPLLLARGYHVRVDVPTGAAGRADAVVTRPFGPDPWLAPVLAERLATVGGRSCDGVVLAAAGSSDPSGARDVEQMAGWLSRELGRAVTPGYASASRPSVNEAVAALRGQGATRVAVASYLLAPGHFADRLGGCGADVISAPLSPHPVLAEIVLRRYDEAA